VREARVFKRAAGPHQAFKRHSEARFDELWNVMEALDDLLSDSDYEGPASKLGLGARPSASAIPKQSSGFAWRALERIEEPDADEASRLPGTNLYGNGDPWNEFGGDEFIASDHDDEPQDYLADAEFTQRQRLWNFSAMDLGRDDDDEEEALDRDNNAEKKTAHSPLFGGRGVADLAGIHDFENFEDGMASFEDLERKIGAFADEPLSEWAATGFRMQGDEDHANGGLDYASDGGDSAEEALHKAAEEDIAALLRGTKPAPGWGPPSAQTTCEGESQSPHSDVGAGALPGRSLSSPSTPWSAASRKESLEAELCTKSDLISGFDRLSYDGAAGSSPISTLKGRAAVAEEDSAALVRERVAAQINAREVVGDGAGVWSPRPDLIPSASAASVAANSTGAAEDDAGASGGLARSSSKPRTFLKKGSRNPRSLGGGAGTAQVRGKAHSMPRLTPVMPADDVLGSNNVARPRRDIQVDVRMPLSMPPGRDAKSLADNTRHPDSFASNSITSPEFGDSTDFQDDIRGHHRYTATVPAASSRTVSNTAAFGAVADGAADTRSVTSPDFGSYDDFKRSVGGYSGQRAGGGSAVSGDDEWADSSPWDCRGADPNLELDLDMGGAAPGRYSAAAAPLPGEPPTSKVVNAYFQSAAAPHSRQGGEKPRPGQPQHSAQAVRHSHWEGDAAYSALYNLTGKDPTTPEFQNGSWAGEPHEAQSAEAFQHEETMRLAALDQQIQKYEKESELLKKLRAQVEQSERDLAREREKLHKEVETERQAIHAEFDSEHAALKRERRRLVQAAERQRQQVSEDREAADEHKRMRERTEQLEEELREKDKRWTRTVDRLQRQVGDLTKKNQELEEEVKRAGLQANQSQFAQARSNSARGRRPSSATRARTPTPTTAARVDAGPPYQAWQAQNGMSKPSNGEVRPRGKPSGESMGAEHGGSASHISSASGAVHGDVQLGAHAQRNAPPGTDMHGEHAGSDVRETRNKEGRVERAFYDGRSEIEFANGLKKVMHPDGRTQVFFQNGDEKEIRPDGVIVYSYFATKAVQTTLPDGCELYQFQAGQFEKHHPDGSQEIHFPNGTTKRIQSDGSEEVTFPDGTVRRTASTASIVAH